MGLVFGMDEAGYGPNLGPLVITVTAWEVPGIPTQTDFWTDLDSLVARTSEQAKDPSKMFVGDSKEVYTPAKGIELLEQSVLTLLTPLFPPPVSFQELRTCLAPDDAEQKLDAAWYREELAIPCAGSIPGGLAERWQALCQETGIVFRGAASDVVFTNRYNHLISLYENKGLTLSRLSLKLLRTLWDPDGDMETSVLADKHGGRNRYDGLLAEVLDDQFIFRLEEGMPLSRYRVGKTELRFQTKAESHFPVAVASMISKYLRELAMICFNNFWALHVPGIKPTKGYPVDARRFRSDIKLAQEKLAIPDTMLWRER